MKTLGILILCGLLTSPIQAGALNGIQRLYQAISKKIPAAGLLTMDEKQFRAVVKVSESLTVGREIDENKFMAVMKVVDEIDPNGRFTDKEMQILETMTEEQWDAVQKLGDRFFAAGRLDIDELDAVNRLTEKQLDIIGKLSSKE